MAQPTTAKIVPPASLESGLPAPVVRPTVDVRVVLFSVVAGSLQVATIDDRDGVRLPRGWPTPEAGVDEDARRIVRSETGLDERYLEQLYTFGAADVRWTIVVSYLGLILSEGIAPPIVGGRWSAAEGNAALGPVDRSVLDYAVRRLRAKLGYTSVAFFLLPPTFTLRELQDAYEAILGRALDKRNFRRRVITTGLIVETGERRREGNHRPAQLYRVQAGHDEAAYLTPQWTQGSPTNGEGR